LKIGYGSSLYQLYQSGHNKQQLTDFQTWVNKSLSMMCVQISRNIGIGEISMFFQSIKIFISTIF
jgi:hypothetical protein